METVKHNLTRLHDNLISVSEFHLILAKQNIHGALRKQGFIGYDYKHQEWIDIPD